MKFDCNEDIIDYYLMENFIKTFCCARAKLRARKKYVLVFSIFSKLLLVVTLIKVITSKGVPEIMAP